MTSSTRLILSAMMIFFSALYGAVLIQSPSTAAAIATGYIAFVLTVFLITNVWKKP